MSKTLQNSPQHIEPKYRIGAIAKMSGVAVATLRAWQRRYGVVQPQKSSGGQRLFDEQDLSKLKCIKELIDLGFAIGTLVHLQLSELAELKQRTLLKRGLTQPPSLGAQAFRVCVVGAGLKDKLLHLEQSSKTDQTPLLIEQEFANDKDALDALHAPNPPQKKLVHACIVKLNTLQSQNLPSIQALQAQFKGASMGVIYHYANPQVLSLLTGTNVELLAYPYEANELDDFVKLLRQSSLNYHQSDSWPPRSRRFTPQALEFISRIESNIGCECPRHIAQMVEQLASFEQYSLECLSLNPKDQHVHKMLTHVASQTLSQFEHALQEVIMHEKIQIPNFPIDH